MTSIQQTTKPLNSPELELFNSSARGFLAKEASVDAVRDLHRRGSAFDPKWWQKAAQLGWTALLVPEDLGGGNVSGDGLRDLAYVAQLAGHTAAPGPLHPVSTVLAGLVGSSDSSRHSEIIGALLEGEAIASWAVYEPGRPWQPELPHLRAVERAGGYALTGVKDRVESGSESTFFLVVAACGPDVRQFVVNADAPGVRIETQQSLDLVKSYARVHFDDVEVDATRVVGTTAETAGLIARQAQVAQVLQCAEVVGVLEAVLDFTVQWAFDRYTFGRPLASYQSLKHRFADMRTWLEASRATVAAAVEDVGRHDPDADISVSIAKSYVGEHAVAIVQDCVQIHGGIGVTWEHDLHIYLRRVMLYRSMFGTPEDHNDHVFARFGDSEESV